jgi:cell division protease FtsH
MVERKRKNRKPTPAGIPARKSPAQAPVAGQTWTYLIWFLALWFLFSYVFSPFGQKNRTTIPYSVFKEQVARDNVLSITDKADQISGEFRNKYQVVTGSGKDTTGYKYFSTTSPAFADPGLMQDLEQHSVTVSAESTESSTWYSYFLILVLPWLMIVGYFWYARRKMQGDMKGMMGGGGIFGIGKSRAKRYKEDKPHVTFDDVAGLDNAKQSLREIIEYLREPEKFTSLGASVPKGVLLMGPPGTGKTLLARATAGEAGVTFFSISGSEFIEMFVGVGASRVRDLFDSAKKDAPSVIFVDEIDSVGRSRGTGLGGGNDEREQTLNQILSEMDGFEPHESVVVMAATNRPDVLDAALTRPGRFDRQITLDLPMKTAREQILRIHTRHVPLADSVDLDNLAARTVGFSGADLKNLVNEAALLAGRKSRAKVEREDFEQARDQILLGSEHEEKIEEDEKKVIAYHEAGHALVARLLPNTDPIQKVTIIPRGQSLGATEQVPEVDRHNYSRSYLLDRITVALGGRASEKLVFGELTSGAASDLKSSTLIARRMVCQWGMSDKLGPITFRQAEEQVFLGREIVEPKDFSEDTARVIDEEVQKILKQMEARAADLVLKNRDKLDALAQALVVHETLEGIEIDKILNVQPREEAREKADAQTN